MSLVDDGLKPIRAFARARGPRARVFVVLAAAAVVVVALVSLACGGSEFTLAAPGSDGGATEDGGAPKDAAIAEANTGPFCVPDAYDFCADFDNGSLATEWHTVSTGSGATGAEDNAASVSAPNSYLAISPALASVDASTQPTAYAILTQPSLPSGETHIAFDIRIDELDFPNGSDPNASVIVMAYIQGSNYALALAFHPAPNAPFAVEAVESSTMVGSSTPTIKTHALAGVLTSVGVWYNVTLDFTIDGATNPLAVAASLGVTSGGATTMVPFILSPPVGTALGARSLSVGVEATAAVGQAKIRFDNVTYKH